MNSHRNHGIINDIHQLLIDIHLLLFTLIGEYLSLIWIIMEYTMVKKMITVYIDSIGGIYNK